MVDDTLAPLIEPVQTHLLPLLQDALAACADRHQLSIGRGSDNFSFGTDAWSLPSRVFRDSAADGRIPFLVKDESACVLGLGNFRLHHHRVGSTERDDIWVCVPQRAEAAAASAAQLSFTFAEPENNEPPPLTVVLAYMANQQDGLCAAYLATIGSVVNGKIAGWDRVEGLWSRDGTLAVLPRSEQKTAVAAEPVRRPVVRLKSKKASDATEA